LADVHRTPATSGGSNGVISEIRGIDLVNRAVQIERSPLRQLAAICGTLRAQTAHTHKYRPDHYPLIAFHSAPALGSHE
jgi:hypothetical protein